MTEDPYSPPSTASSVDGDPHSGMTAAAKSQGARNALICAVPVLAVGGFVYWLLVGFAGVAWMTALFFAFIIPFAASLLVMLIAWVRGRSRRGELLIDCGPHPGRQLFLLNAVIFFIPGVGSFALSSGSSATGTLGPVFTTLFAAYWLFMATGRFAVHEAGLWVYHSLVPWDRISDYSWASDNTLIIRTTGMWSLLRSATPVPAECVEDVTRLLRQHESESTG